jgi:hypothetical protein
MKTRASGSFAACCVAVTLLVSCAAPSRDVGHDHAGSAPGEKLVWPPGAAEGEARATAKAAGTREEVYLRFSLPAVSLEDGTLEVWTFEANDRGLLPFVVPRSLSVDRYYGLHRWFALVIRFDAAGNVVRTATAVVL